MWSIQLITPIDRLVRAHVTPGIVRLILSSSKISCHVKIELHPDFFSFFFYSLSPSIKLDGLPQPVEIGFNKECWENSVRGRDPSSLSIKVSSRESRCKRKKIEREREKPRSTFNHCQPDRNADDRGMRNPAPTVTGGWAIGTGGRESTSGEKMLKSAIIVIVINSLGGSASQSDLARFSPQPQFPVKCAFGPRSEAARWKGGRN